MKTQHNKFVLNPNQKRRLLEFEKLRNTKDV